MDNFYNYSSIKTCCGYSLELLRQGDCNEYPRLRKLSFNYHQIPTISVSLAHYPPLGLNSIFEPFHEIVVLFVLPKLILQMRMHSHPMGLDVWVWVGSFVYFHTLCVRTAKALARLCGCAGSPEPSLVAYVISSIISWAGSFAAL